MQPETYKVTSHKSASVVAERLLNADYEKPLVVTVGPLEKKRSLDANALSHVWYERISQVLQEDTPLGVKCECKLTLGVPILRAEDEEFRKFYDTALKHLSYEQKLEAMKFVPVTSRMKKGQMSRYMNDMQMVYAKRGVNLE